MTELAEFYDIGEDQLRLAPKELVDAAQAAFDAWYDSTGRVPICQLKASMGDPTLFRAAYDAQMARQAASRPKYDA